MHLSLNKIAQSLLVLFYPGHFPRIDAVIKMINHLQTRNFFDTFYFHNINNRVPSLDSSTAPLTQYFVFPGLTALASRAWRGLGLSSGPKSQQNDLNQSQIPTIWDSDRVSNPMMLRDS